MKESRADFTRRVTAETLKECVDIGVEKYKIDTCGDSRVCAACEVQEGKEYPVKDAVLGVNAPPFCDECRCVIMPVFD